MTSKVRPSLPAGIEATNGVQSFRPNKDIENLFKSLSEKRTEIKNALYKFVLENRGGITRQGGLVVIRGEKSFLKINAYLYRQNSDSPSVEILLGKNKGEHFTESEMSAIKSHKIALYNHETGLMCSRPVVCHELNDTYAITLDSVKCLEQAPEYLTNSIEKFVPNKWLHDAGLFTSPPYLSLVELKK